MRAGRAWARGTVLRLVGECVSFGDDDGNMQRNKLTRFIIGSLLHVQHYVNISEVVTIIIQMKS